MAKYINTQEFEGDIYVKGIGGYDGDDPSFDLTLLQVIELIEQGTPTFGGLQIDAGPLVYENGAFVRKTDWNYDSYGVAKGTTNGSSYFGFYDMGNLFETKTSFSNRSGSIENNLGPFGAWRLPTKDEFVTLTTGTRVGSFVNGTSGAKYALIQLTGVTHAGSSTPNGLLLFPDGRNITGVALSGINNYTHTTGVTITELNNYLSQGCAFLPASGCYRYNGWEGGGLGLYMSSFEYDRDNYYGLNLWNDGFYPDDFDNIKNTFYNSVRLVRRLVRYSS